jgi:hypothetical protein
MTVDLEAELNRLYQAPLADFVTQRNQLARALKQAGAKAEAERVSKLVRPSPVAWVLNQLYFRQEDALSALMGAGTALKRAQEELAAADEFADSKSAYQRALRIASEAVVTIAEDSGMVMNAGLRRRLELAVAVMSAGAGTGAAPLGRMSTEPEPAGFDAFSTSEARLASLPARGAPDEGANEAKAKRTALEAARAAFAAIEAELQRLEEEARAAHERYEEAAREAAEVEKRADAARRARDEARRDSEAAKTKADEVRGQLARQRKALGDDG